MPSMEFTAGILLCGAIRDYLKRKQFVWPNVQWVEGSGWFERTWVVKADAAHLSQLRRELHAWFASLEEPAQ